ncbi:MAG: hypothetical protein JNK02_02670 [Planctomycetes bacterium]|nr:hypothetical protein [Planctomycetota bacterium]
MTARFAFALSALALAPHPSNALGSACPGAPLACVASGSQTLVVAVGLPPHALGILVAGPGARPGSSFGSGRWCVTDPRVRLAATCADEDGTAVVRLAGRPHELAGSSLQVLWRDRLSGRTGASGVTRLPGG